MDESFADHVRSGVRTVAPSGAGRDRLTATLPDGIEESHAGDEHQAADERSQR